MHFQLSEDRETITDFHFIASNAPDGFAVKLAESRLKHLHIKQMFVETMWWRQASGLTHKAT